MNQKTMIKSRLLVTPIFIVILFACTTIPQKTYEETVSEWKSYQDVAKWMSLHFSYDRVRFGLVENTVPDRRSPEETFKLKSGVCYDAAFFAKDTLNRINPAYEAKVLFIDNRPYATNHFVCSFKNEGKIYIMDYGMTDRTILGVHGPFNSLDEYKKFYERYHPKVKHVQGIYDWPIF
jgi:hypothetical protein